MKHLLPAVVFATLAFVFGEPKAAEPPETDDPCLPALREQVRAAAVYATSLVEEADEGDAPPDVFNKLCRTADRLWAAYDELTEAQHACDSFGN